MPARVLQIKRRRRVRANGRELRPGFKLWLSAGETEGVFGGGKWRLLEAIDKAGSLRGAAQSLGISYRKAWGDLRKAEEALGAVFVERHRGGSNGGDMLLTETGRKWVVEYARFQSNVKKAIDKEFRSWTDRIAGGRPRKGVRDEKRKP